LTATDKETSNNT